MRRNRSEWVLGLAALCAVLAVTLVALVRPQPARAICIPVPPLTTCPSAPNVRIDLTTDVGHRSATLHGTVNTGGAATSYHWTYAPASGATPPQATPSVTLKAASSADKVSTRISGLRPGVSYTISLDASNSQGRISVTRTYAFKTTAHPVFDAFKLSSQTLTYGSASLQLTIRLGGAYDPDAEPSVFVARQPFKRWVFAGKASSKGNGTFTITPCPTSAKSSGCSWFDRNFRVRAEMQGRQSHAKLVYVEPRVVVTGVRANHNRSNYINMTFRSLGHVSSHYNRERVYFYLGSSQNGPFHRVSSARLAPHRTSDGAQLVAMSRVLSRQSAYVHACYRSPLWGDMGPRFVFTSCGSEHLS